MHRIGSRICRYSRRVPAFSERDSSINSLGVAARPGGRRDHQRKECDQKDDHDPRNTPVPEHDDDDRSDRHDRSGLDDYQNRIDSPGQNAIVGQDDR